MPLPSLPLDIWFRISTYLNPPELSSLSQVCRPLNKIATDEEHFQRHLPVPDTKFNHPAQLYRRHRALRHPPESFTTSQLRSYICMLCVVQETLLLFDAANSRLFAIPSGLTFDLRKLIGKNGRTFLRLRRFHDALVKSILVLPEGHVALLWDGNPTSINILNVHNGETITHSLPGRETKITRTVDEKSIAVAGNDAEYLSYYTEPNVLALFDWRKGIQVRKVRGLQLGRGVTLMKGECPSIGGMSVVGWVIEKHSSETPYWRTVCAIGFDGIREIFRLPRGTPVKGVLRSADKKMTVLVVPNGSFLGTAAGFSKRNGDSIRVCYMGNFPLQELPELRENGRLIVKKGKPSLLANSFHGSRSNLYSRKQWDVLNDDGSILRESTPGMKDRLPPIWFRRTNQGFLALMVAPYTGEIELVNLVEDGNTMKFILLKSWTIHGLLDISVLADHLIFAMSLGRKLHVIHFDRFCCGGGGLYACPLLGFNRKETDSPAQKKRRISN